MVRPLVHSINSRPRFFVPSQVSIAENKRAGNLHALSTSASDRVTDERTASGLTLVWLTIRLAPPAKVVSTNTPASSAIFNVRLIGCNSVRSRSAKRGWYTVARHHVSLPLASPETVGGDH